MSTAEVIEPDSVSSPEKDTSSQETAQLIAPERKAHLFQKGHDPRRNVAGNRPKKLREIEMMLNKEHRNVEAMREVFARLRALALGEVVVVSYFNAENLQVELKAELKADARFMQLYLDRLLGPAKAFEQEMDLSDAPDQVIEYLYMKVKKKAP